MECTLEQLTLMREQTLFGIPIQQTWTALFMLEKLITEQKFDIIFELGTGAGGLTRFFFGRCITVMSFDIKNGYDVFGSAVQLHIFKHSLDRKTMVFCDNGDKPREIKEYAPMLKKGDFILGHDYRRPGGIPEDFDYESLGLETYNQNDWDRMQTYILCMRKK